MNMRYEDEAEAESERGTETLADRVPAGLYATWYTFYILNKLSGIRVRLY